MRGPAKRALMFGFFLVLVGVVLVLLGPVYHEEVRGRWVEYDEPVVEYHWAQTGYVTIDLFGLKITVPRYEEVPHVRWVTRERYEEYVVRIPDYRRVYVGYGVVLLGLAMAGYGVYISTDRYLKGRVHELLREGCQTPQRVADELDISVDRARRLLEKFVEEDRAIKVKRRVRFDGGLTLDLYVLISNIDVKFSTKTKRLMGECPECGAPLDSEYAIGDVVTCKYCGSLIEVGNEVSAEEDDWIEDDEDC